MGKQYRQLNWTDRLRIETLLKEGLPKKKIAESLGVHVSTIYREVSKGLYRHKNTDWTYTVTYSSDFAQKIHEEGLRRRGTQLKIGNDIAYANYLERRVCYAGLSPAATLGELRKTGHDKDFKTQISLRTFYNYIEWGVFLNLTYDSLPQGKRKRRNRKIPRAKRPAAGTSIEQRPEEIKSREEFGNWEMDSILGKKGISENTLLSIVERQTRATKIEMLKGRSKSKSVVKALDDLERRLGKEGFKKVFKTITVDNGAEFALCRQLERSVFGGDKRTKVYYCHPYSAWERGTNENTNRLIRRKIPKGTDFDDEPPEKIKEVEDWVNGYPREVLGYDNPRNVLNARLASLGIAENAI